MLILTLLNEILKPIQAVCYKGIKCCIMMQCFQINETNKSFKCCHLIVSSITLLHPYMHLIWDVARVYFGVFVVYEMASVQTVIYNIQHKMLTESTATILLIGMQYLIVHTNLFHCDSLCKSFQCSRNSQRKPQNPREITRYIPNFCQLKMVIMLSRSMLSVI